MPIQKKCAKNAHFCHPSKSLKNGITLCWFAKISKIILKFVKKLQNWQKYLLF